MRLLIVKTSSMGDVVHALPAVSDIQRAHAAAGSGGGVKALEVDWLVEPAFAAIPALHPGVTQVHRLPWRKWRRQLTKATTWHAMAELTNSLRARRYDLVIDCQGLLKSALWARRAAAPVAGYDRHSIREPLASLLYAQRHAVPRSMQAVMRCRLLVGSAVAAQMGWNPPTAQSLPPADFGLRAVQPHRAEALDAGPYAVLIPNASRPEKLWPDADWEAVGLSLRQRGWQPVVLWGSPAEEAMARRIAEACGAWVPPFLTVEEAARLLAGAQAVVGLDTGFSHVAAALGRPVVGIYCDHEPALAGITGSGPVRSLGGKGQRPTQEAVLSALDEVLAASV